jgi:hypothetical protein
MGVVAGEAEAIATTATISGSKKMPSPIPSQLRSRTPDGSV